MEDQENYTPEQVCKILKLYGDYRADKLNYEHAKDNKYVGRPTLEYAKKNINELVDNCEKHIPKSLIDKLEIKKIE